MYKHLYEIFKHWYHQGSIYFIGDTHFGDLDCYMQRGLIKKPKLSKEDFNEVDPDEDYNEFLQDYYSQQVTQLDQMQINNINKVCGKNDTLVILGDVGCDLSCISKLKAGYKVLIMGNHDKGASNYKSKEENLFDEVYEGTLQISPNIILSHEPVEYPYCLNIHGHNHNVNPLGAYTEGIGCTHHYNCCAEQINYKPVCINRFYNLGIMKKIPNIHRETIDKAIERKEAEKQKEFNNTGCFTFDDLLEIAKKITSIAEEEKIKIETYLEGLLKNEPNENKLYNTTGTLNEGDLAKMFEDKKETKSRLAHLLDPLVIDKPEQAKVLKEVLENKETK